jgi:3-deoxy-manno-octulosonate cytidylyltransferase (CMP-KDO synthetase)
MGHPQGRGVVGIIPARYGSTRFPGKVLVRWRGRTLLEHVFRRVSRCVALDSVLVAVEDDRVEAEARRLGARVVRTSPEHPSGTDRIGEVVRALEAPPAGVVNIQADEPLLDPQAVDALARALMRPGVEMVTLAHEETSEAALRSPDVVKVVRDLEGYALYFSRSAIPHRRGGGDQGTWLRHVGLYGYRTDVLLRLVASRPTPLERAEGLEQLRALELGIRILVLVGPWRSQAVDRPEDLQRLDEMLDSRRDSR